MVSTRSASKRPSSDDADSTTAPKRARKAKKKPSTRPLLDLPFEIRHLILRELLWQKDPLDFNAGLATREVIDMLEYDDRYLLQTSPPSQQLHPNILRTCKQMYTEAVDVLYSNTINCRIGLPGCSGNTEEYPTILSEKYIFHSNVTLPIAVTQKMCRLRIQLFAHHHWAERRPSAERIEEGLRKLAHVFQTHQPAWKYITIQMIHINKWFRLAPECDDPKINALFETSLRPLRFIRSRSSVTVTGVSKSLASKLRNLMLSTEPFVDLEMAMDSLSSYCIGSSRHMRHDDERLNQLSRDISRLIDKGGEASDAGDIDLFMRLRRCVLALVKDFQSRLESKVFEHDLPPTRNGATSPRPTLNDADAADVTDLLNTPCKDALFPGYDPSILHKTEEDGTDSEEEDEEEEDYDYNDGAWDIFSDSEGINDSSMLGEDEEEDGDYPAFMHGFLPPP